MGRRLVVRVLLEGGTYLDIPMLDVEATSFVAKWKPKPTGEWERVVVAGGTHMAFDPKRVQAMHTWDPEEAARIQAAQAEAQGTRPQQPLNRPFGPFDGSGHRNN